MKLKYARVHRAHCRVCISVEGQVRQTHISELFDSFDVPDFASRGSGLEDKNCAKKFKK